MDRAPARTERCDSQKTRRMTAARSISQALQKATCLATYEVNVRGREPKVSCEKRGRRQPRESRKATVECRCTVTLRARYRPDRKLPDVTVNVVQVRELALQKTMYRSNGYCSRVCQSRLWSSTACSFNYMASGGRLRFSLGS
jgi:hypothetical protein